MARLPGGLAAWRGRRLLRGAGGPDTATVSVPVGAVRHAALHSLVIEAAKYADTHPPRVALTGSGTVRAADGVLHVGLPLVWGLPADHLRIVLAHELALPDTKHPDLVRDLLAADGAKVLAATGPLRAAVEQVRDAAAIAAGGGGLSGVEDAAAALLRAATVEAAFAAFAASEGRHSITRDTAAKVPVRIADRSLATATSAEVTVRIADRSLAAATSAEVTVRIADLHAGWRLRLERWGAPAVDGGALLDEVPRRHPGLAADLRALTEVPRPGLAGDAVVLDTLTADEELALAAEVIDGDGDWTRFEELPVEVYGAEVERQAREYVQAVRTVLGRDPDGRAELAGTLLRRPVDVERARRGETGDGHDDQDQPAPPWMGVVLLSVLVESTLLGKGWRREHPLVARRLVSTGGEVLDLNELYQRPDELRELFATG
ncbi:hypothetical protein [Dactylosporangium sp. NPDC005555]|uniref:hypothetical protein n=1 Tax=Dactylosporangium sp. NPDC005555 TaxID=3154889 RepID=UPI0033AC7DE7